MASKKRLDSHSNRLKFHYIKGNDFRVIKADGAWGGITPRLDIQMSLYSERIALPDLEEAEISTETGTAKVIRTERKTQGIIREVEAAILMNGAVARSLGEWLISQANALDKAIAASAENDHEEVAE